MQERNLSKVVSEKLYGVKEENLVKHIIHDVELSKRHKITEEKGFIKIELYLTNDLAESEVTYSIDFETYHKHLYYKLKMKGASK